MPSMISILRVTGLCIGLALTGCAASRLPSATQPEIVLPDRAVYALPDIQQTYIAPHVTRKGLLQGAHDVYWLSEKGHWLAPQHDASSSSDALLEAYQPPGI